MAKKKQIESQHDIEVAARDARQQIADAAADALRTLNAKTSNDHDLIIRLDTKMDDLKADIKELKDGTTTKIENLEMRTSANENGITQIKTYGSAILIFIGIIEYFVVKLHLFG